MSSKAAAVYMAWINHEPFSSGGALWTQGGWLYSYNLLIGYMNDQGSPVVIDYRGREVEVGEGVMRKSPTTSRHINGALRFASIVESPDDE